MFNFKSVSGIHNAFYTDAGYAHSVKNEDVQNMKLVLQNFNQACDDDSAFNQIVYAKKQNFDYSLMLKNTITENEKQAEIKKKAEYDKNNLDCIKKYGCTLKELERSIMNGTFKKQGVSIIEN